MTLKVKCNIERSNSTMTVDAGIEGAASQNEVYMAIGVLESLKARLVQNVNSQSSDESDDLDDDV